MTKEVERVGIPVAMISALPVIPLSIGAHRVVRGVRVEHLCGDPRLPPEQDRALMRRIVLTALRALRTPVTEPTIFEPSETPVEEKVHAA